MELSDNMLVAASGDQGQVEMFVEWLKVSSLRLSCSTVATRTRRHPGDRSRLYMSSSLSENTRSRRQLKRPR